MVSGPSHFEIQGRWKNIVRENETREVTSIAVLLIGFISSVLVIATDQSVSGKEANSISLRETLLIFAIKSQVIGHYLRSC
jgi:hypothetical protein